MSLSFLNKLKPPRRHEPPAIEPSAVTLAPFTPPPDVTSKIGRLLLNGPLPLIHSEARMIVVFSAKSACTNVAVWFFHHLGHAKAARDFNPWPHRYRIEVYYRSELYHHSLKQDFSGFKVVRIVRDPFERAVSSFLHVAATRLAEDPEFVRLLGRGDVNRDGMSFTEFLDVLEQTDLQNCDEHYRIQKHPLEDTLAPDYLINVSTEDLFARLNAVEADLGLPRSDLAASPWINSLRRRRYGNHTAADITDATTMRFNRRRSLRGPWPPYAAFLTPPVRQRLARLYAVDVAAYGNEPVS
jgi:hypothetical protein